LTNSRLAANHKPVATVCGGRRKCNTYSKADAVWTVADAKSGKLLWHFQASENWKASPMTFMAGGKQYVAVAAGPNVLAFALP
jgi:hypothetical protein